MAAEEGALPPLDEGLRRALADSEADFRAALPTLVRHIVGEPSQHAVAPPRPERVQTLSVLLHQLRAERERLVRAKDDAWQRLRGTREEIMKEVEQLACTLAEIDAQERRDRASLDSWCQQLAKAAERLRGEDERVAAERCRAVYERVVSELEAVAARCRQLATVRGVASGGSELSAQVCKWVELVRAARPRLVPHLHRVAVGALREFCDAWRGDVARRVGEALEAAGWPRASREARLDRAALRRGAAALAHALVWQVAHEAATRAGKEKDEGEEESAEGGDAAQRNAPRLWAVELLAAPIETRFRYHFEGPRETNRLERPEWYLSFVANAIAYHASWVAALAREVETADPKAAEAAAPLLARADAASEFVERLVRLARDKFEADLSRMVEEESGALLRHAVGQVLLFHSRLSLSLHYPPSAPSCLDVLCAPATLAAWVRVERAAALSQLEAALAAPDAWHPTAAAASDAAAAGGDTPLGTSAAKAAAAEESDLRPTRCAEDVLTLLQGVTEQAELLPRMAPRHRLFTGVQLEVAQGFRAKLETLLAAATRDATREAAYTPELWLRVCGLLNSARFVELVLGDWAERVGFLQLLLFERLQRDAVSAAAAELDALTAAELLEHPDMQTLRGSLWAPVVEALHHVQRRHVEELVEGVAAGFIRALDGYRPAGGGGGGGGGGGDEKGGGASEAVAEVSVTLVAPLGVLMARMSALELHLAPSLHRVFWTLLAGRLSRALFPRMFIALHIDRSAAVQLRCDVEALFALWRTLTAAPQNFFPHLKDALRVLQLSPRELVRLRATLAAGPSAQARQAVSALGVTALPVREVRELAARVLSQEQAALERDERRGGSEGKGRARGGEDGAEGAANEEEEEEEEEESKQFL